MRKAAKIFLVSLAGLIVVSSAVLFYLGKKHRKEAHQKIVEYLNRELGEDVNFKDFSLSYLRSFPRIHVEIVDLTIDEDGRQLLRAGEIDIMLNLLGVMNKKIKIERLIVSDVQLNQYIDSLGFSRRLPAQKTMAGDTTQSSILLESHKIELRDVHLSFHNKIKHNRSYIRIMDAHLKLKSNDSLFILTGRLEGHLDSLISNNSLLFMDQPAIAKNILFKINRKTGEKVLEKGSIQSHSLILHPILRMVPSGDGQMIELNISGEDRFDEFVGLFAFKAGIDVQQTNPDARLNLTYHQKGFVNPYQRPYSEVLIDVSDAIFTGEKLPFPLELTKLTGNYNNGESHSPETVELVIDSIYAQMKDSYIQGHFTLSNLKDPVIDAHLTSSVDLSHLVRETKKFKLTGEVELDLIINGKISEFRKFHLDGRQQAKAELKVHDLELMFKEKGLSLKIKSGSTILNNHLLEITPVSGAFNETDFHFQGRIENLDKFLLDEKEFLNGEMLLNFDELDLVKIDLPSSGKEPPSQGNYYLPFSTVSLALKVNGKKVVTPFGDLRNFSSNLQLDDYLLTINSLRFDYQDGKVESSGQVTLDEEGIVAVSADIKGNFNRLDLDLPMTKKNINSQHKGISIPDYINAQVILHVKQGTIAGIPLKQLDIKARMKGHDFYVDQFQVQAFDGMTSLTGQATLDSAGLQRLKVRANMDFNHLEPDQVMKTFSSNQTEGPEKKGFQLPPGSDIELAFHAKKISFKDLSLTHTGFSLHGTDHLLEIKNLHTAFPFGKFRADASITNYTTSDYSISAKVDLSLDSLDVKDLLSKEYIRSLMAPEKTEKAASPPAKTGSGLPDNIELDLTLTAGKLMYKQISASSVELDAEYNSNGIVLRKFDAGFAGGTIHLDGRLGQHPSGSYPGHAYLKTDNLDLSTIFKSFDDFNQDAFTSINSHGNISTATHHYFTLDKNLEFIRDENFWLGNILVHHAEFDRVEPIEKSLFFIGHKAKDTMIVNELNVNILLAKDKLYFRDLLMNNNIANLSLSGEIHLDAHEMDFWAEISLSDLFFRSKGRRVAETQEGIFTLDNDSRLYLRMYGPLNDHKLNMVNKRKFNAHQDDLIKAIARAQKNFKETASTD